MTKETDIDMPTEKEILIECLKDLCQHHYLPFSTKKYNSPANIVEEFLDILNSEKLDTSQSNSTLMECTSMLGIVPGFHLLEDFTKWGHKPINSYQVLAKIDAALLSDIFNEQDIWAVKDKSFSQEVISTLNDGEKNGRLKIVIKLKLNTENNVTVRYIHKYKTIEYLIPKCFHCSLFNGNFLKGLTYNEYAEVIVIEKDNNAQPISEQIPDINSADFIDFNGYTEFKNLAKDIYPVAVKHSLYIQDDTLLLYIFSNNAIWYEHRRDVGLGGMFLLLKREIFDDADCRECQTIINYFSRLTDALSSRLINFHQIQNITHQATRAAISQVMARNTSHNIGAHVMNKLIEASSLEKIGTKKDSLKSYKPDKDFEDEVNHKPFQQIALFNNYVKCRMDYLADISFGTPLMQTNKYVYGELFTDLDKVRLLLEHISGLDKFEYKIEFKRNGEKFKAEGGAADDLLVAIPNDILGTQAFYNILENIIRNTAKHSDKSGLDGKPVVFTVNFIDGIKGTTGFCDDENCNRENCKKSHKKEIENALNEFIAVEVYDNIPIVGKVKDLSISPEDKSEYKEKMKAEFEGEKFGSFIEKLVFTQNKKLNENILQDDSKLRSSSLGLVEMDASAAYLRKRPVEYINHQSYDIQYDESWSRDTELNKEKDKDPVELRGTNCRHFLKAFNKKENGNNYLGYRFFLLRPAVVLVVTDAPCEKKDELKKEGIWVVAKNEFVEDLGKGKVYSHEFVVIDSSLTLDKITEREFLEYYKTSLPIRVLKDVPVDNLLMKTTLKEFEEICWEEWFKKIKEKNPCKCNENSCKKKHYFGITGNYNSNLCHDIVLFDHLYENDNSQNKNAEKMWKELEAQNCIAEALSSIAQTKLPGYYNTLQNTSRNTEDGIKKHLLQYILSLNETLKKKIAEAAFSKVIVIDERIQEAANTRDFMKIKFDRLYKKMNVIIPDKNEINLSANTFDPVLICKLKKYLGLTLEANEKCDEIKDATKELRETDFILIHYSILERMFEKKAINSRIEEIASKGANVIVTSGRGTPENLSPKARFVNLSSVINAFVDIRSKFIINYLFNSSRKSNKI